MSGQKAIRFLFPSSHEKEKPVRLAQDLNKRPAEPSFRGNHELFRGRKFRTPPALTPFKATFVPGRSHEPGGRNRAVPCEPWREGYKSVEIGIGGTAKNVERTGPPTAGTTPFLHASHPEPACETACFRSCAWRAQGTAIAKVVWPEDLHSKASHIRGPLVP